MFPNDPNDTSPDPPTFYDVHLPWLRRFVNEVEMKHQVHYLELATVVLLLLIFHCCYFCSCLCCCCRCCRSSGKKPANSQVDSDDKKN